MRSELAATVMAVLSACAVGRPPEQRDVDHFRVGVTTRADAERVLGPPQYLTQEGDGMTGLVWSLGQSGPPTGGAGGKLVSLVFGRDGKLARPPAIAYSGAFPTPEAGASLQPATKPIERCEKSADCPQGGICLAGVCRK